jgi:electron transfer flavoprotein alpha subunit
MAQADNAELKLLTFGSDPEKLAALTVEKTGFSTVAFVGKDLEQFHPEVFRKVLADFLLSRPCSLLFLPHSLAGSALAPLLACDLSALCVTGVTQCQAQGGSIIAIRPVYKGKWREEVRIAAGNRPPVVMTVQPGALDGFTPEGTGGRLILVPVTTGEDGCRLLAVEKKPEDGGDLTQAKVVVAVGRGLGAAENIPLIEELAALFPSSAIGASRAVCDAGWMNYGKQVGLTGRSVSPSLYLACGISGTSQHVAGMKGAQWVVALNTDPRAPIFQVAHVAVVEDMFDFIPLLVAAAKTGRPCP